jgi:putative hydrolase of the HAD superfamily
MRGLILSSFKATGGMKDLVVRTREMIPVGLLTDQTNWLYELDERDGFLSTFDAVVNSYEEGFTKRDPEIFRSACQRFHLFPEEVLFFDDTPGNVKAGRHFGMRAYLFEDAAGAERVLVQEGVLE